MSIKHPRRAGTYADGVNESDDTLAPAIDPSGSPLPATDPFELAARGQAGEATMPDPNVGGLADEPGRQTSKVPVGHAGPRAFQSVASTTAPAVQSAATAPAEHQATSLATAVPAAAARSATPGGQAEVEAAAAKGADLVAAPVLAMSADATLEPFAAALIVTPGPVGSAGTLLLVAGLADQTGPSLDTSETSDDTIAGRAIDTAAIVSLTASIDGGAAVNETSDVGSDGRFKLTPAMLAALAGGTLGDGSHTVVVTATDALGNEASAGVAFALDSVAPTLSAALADVTGTSALALKVAATSDDTVSGSVTDPAGIVSLFGTLDGSAAYTDLTGSIGTDGAFTITPQGLDSLAGGSLRDGDHSLVLQATDQAGNVATTTVDFDLLTQISAPTLGLATADQTTDATTTDASAVTLVGQAGPGDSVVLILTGATTVASTAGSFRFDNVPVSVGNNLIEVQASDLADNTASGTLTVQVVAPGGAVDPVLRWNQLTLQAISTDADAPTVASRALAMESLAVYDAISAIDGTPGYLINLTAAADASAAAAVAEAADQVLDYLYPAQTATFGAELATELAAVPQGQGKADGIALGVAAAQAIIALRADDGSQETVVDNGSSAVGQWQPTAPGFANAVTPQWADVTPFALNSPDQFQAPPPPALTSAAYAAAVNETESLGAGDSTTRTAAETQSALWWNLQTGTYTPPGEWNDIASSLAESDGDSMATDAQILAELNVAEADAGIAAWNTKYFYNAWRPITAIQNADEIGNAAIIQDQTWTPLLTTPAFPEYAAGHPVFSAAAAQVLDSFFGSDTAFSATSPSLPGVTMSFTSFDAAAQAAGESRVYGGIHFQFSVDAGLTIGQKVGDWTLQAFNPSVDTVPPKVVFNQTSGLVTNTDPVVTGDVTDNLSGVASLTVSLDGGAASDVTFDREGSFSVPVDLPTDGSADGTHTLGFTATDAAGNVTTPVDFSFTLDSVAPVIGLAADSIQNGGTLAAGAVLDGTVTVESGVTLTALSYALDGGSAVPVGFDASGDFDQALDLTALAAGSHSVVLTAKDAAGNFTSETLDVTLPALPLLTIVSLTPMMDASDVGVTYRPEVTFSRAVDPATVTSGSFYATDSTGAVIPATILMTADDTGAYLLFTNPMPGASTITLHVDGAAIKGQADGTLLDAAGTGVAGSDLTETFTTVSTAGVPDTTITGVVVDPGPDDTPMTPDDVKAAADGLSDFANDKWKLPIAGVMVYVLGDEQDAVYTNAEGQFRLTNVPVGDVKLVINGTTATNPPAGYYFPTMTMDLTNVRPGVANTVMGSMGTLAEQTADAADPVVYLPRVASDILTPLSATEPTVITAPADTDFGSGQVALTAQQLSELSLTVMPGSVVDADGNPVPDAEVGISPVPPAIVQDMLPAGVLQHTFDITIQAPDGAVFTSPATLTVPNVLGLAAGTKTFVLSFDHTTGRLVIDGTATVSADGSTITTDPGSGVTAPGWHGFTPAGSQSNGNCVVPMNMNPCQISGWQFTKDRLAAAGDALGIFQLEKAYQQALQAIGVSVFKQESPIKPDALLTLFDLAFKDLVKQIGTVGHVAYSSVLPLAQGVLGFANAFVLLLTLSELLVDLENADADEFAQVTKCEKEMGIIPPRAPPPSPMFTVDTSVETARGEFLIDEVENQQISQDAQSCISQAEIANPTPAQTNQLVQSLRTLDSATQTLLGRPSLFSLVNDAIVADGEYSGELVSDLFVGDGSEGLGPEAPSISLGPIIYAALEDPDGTIQRFSFSPTTGFTYFLASDTIYVLTVFDPTTGYVGESTFQSAASGSPTNIPLVGMAPDTGTPLADGLTETAAFVVGVNPNITDNLVPGISDLAALQEGLVSASSLASTTSIIASLPLQGSARSVVLVGSTATSTQQTAYVATGTYGLAIIDASNYQAPTVLSQIQLSGTATDVAVDSALGLAAVATGQGGLQIVNVADPTNPTVVQVLPVDATQVQVFEGIAYANDGGQLDAFDLATGAELQSLALGGGTITGMALDGSTLYTMDASDTLRVIDLSSGTMVLDGSVMLPYGGNGLFVANGVAYVGAESINTAGGYLTVDVSNPSAPTLIEGPDNRGIAGAALALNGSGLGVSVEEGRISSGQAVDAFDVFSASDPTNTGRFITQYNLPAHPFGVAIGSGIAFVADASAGLQVVNYTTIATNGVPPTLTVTQDPTDVDPSSPGIQVYEGESISLGVSVSDPGQVRNVELLVNGTVATNLVSFPFDLTAMMPTIADNGSDQVALQVEAVDTGGNITMSNTIDVQLVPDTTPLSLTGENIFEGEVFPQTSRIFTFDFSKPLDPATVSASSFQLIGPGGISVAPSSIQLRASNRLVEVTYGTLSLGSYQFIVDASQITDGSGNPLGSSSFTTDFTVQQFSEVWAGSDGGNWSIASNWSAGVLPGISDDVLINFPVSTTVNLSGGTYIVDRLLMTGTGDLDITGGALTVSGMNSETDAFQSTANINISGGTLTVQNEGTNAGSIIDTGGTINVEGPLTNSGAILIGALGSQAFNGSAYVENTVQNTGAITVGNGGSLVITGEIDGSGKLEATGGGVVVLDDVTQTLSGVFETESGYSGPGFAGGTIDFRSATLVGGAGTLVSIANGGDFYTVDRGSAFDGTAAAVNNAGVVQIQDNTALTLRGTIDNTGMFQLNAGVDATELVIDSTNVTLTGGGQVTLNGNEPNLVSGASAAATLINQDNTISGGGQIGGGMLTLVNQAKGVIDGQGGTIALDTGGNVILNQGLIEGDVVIDSTVDNSNLMLFGALGSQSIQGNSQIDATIHNSGAIVVGNGGNLSIDSAVDNSGTVEATGGGTVIFSKVTETLSGVIETESGPSGPSYAGGNIALQSATIVGGTGSLETISNGGEFYTIGGDSVLDGTAMAVNNAGVVDIRDNTTLTLRGTINNSEMIQLNAGADATDLIIATTNATLTGGGQVTLNGNEPNLITGANAAATLTNVDNTISGGGQIGGGRLTLVNQAKGVIEAQGGTLTLDTGTNTISNAGLLDASPGTMIIESITSNSGVIEADDGAVYLNGAVSNGGLMEAVDAGRIYIDTAVANTGTIVALRANGNGPGTVFIDDVTEVLSGAIETNGGSIALDGATLVGGTGSLLTVSSSGEFYTIGGDSVLDGTAAAVNNAGIVDVQDNTALTLRGAINNTDMIQLNAGADATDLVIDTTSVTLTGDGQVTLNGNTPNLITGASASATLINADNTISGGGQIGGGRLTLVNQAKGVIEAQGGTLTLDTGTNTISNAGLLEAGGGNLTIHSAVSNTGTILADAALSIAGSVSGSGELLIDAGQTLSISGSITGGTATFGGTSGGTLVLGTPNSVTTTIQGFGGSDAIDLTGVAATSLSYTGTTTGGTLTVSGTSGTIATLDFAGDYTTSSFSFGGDGNDGTLLRDPPAAMPPGARGKPAMTFLAPERAIYLSQGHSTMAPSSRHPQPAAVRAALGGIDNMFSAAMLCRADHWPDDLIDVAGPGAIAAGPHDPRPGLDRGQLFGSPHLCSASGLGVAGASLFVPHQSGST